MSRLPGTPKTGGRQKGTPNKLPLKIKGYLAKLIDKNRNQMEADLKELQPKERLLILEKFMQYVIPKQREFDMTEEETNINTKYDEDMMLLKEIPEDVIADIAEQLQGALAAHKA